MRTWPADLPIDVAISFTTCAKPQAHTKPQRISPRRGGGAKQARIVPGA